MKMRVTTACVLLMLSLPVAAEFKTVSLAYEITLSDFRVPATPSSGVILRECADCEMRAIRVTPHTRYLVNGQAVELKDFRKAVFQVRDRQNTFLTVLHHLESDIVVSVAVTI